MARLPERLCSVEVADVKRACLWHDNTKRNYLKNTRSEVDFVLPGFALIACQGGMMT